MSDLEIVRRHMKEGATDIYAILAEIGVTTSERAMTDAVTGTLTRRGRRYDVEINSRLSERKKRFAAAHELAHYLLHRDMIADGACHIDKLFAGATLECSGGLGLFEDAAATRMALQIMLPAEKLHLAWSKLKTGSQDDRVESMAQIFDVGTTTMRIRLQGLNLVGYMLWMKGIETISAAPTRDEIERDASRWYTINHANANGGPYRYDTIEDARRDVRSLMKTGATDHAVTEYDTSRENWNVFERPTDALDDPDVQIRKAA